jgi:pilus assembly protein Flp/PilA
MGQFLKSFAKNESGATAIEYALIAAGIAIAMIAAVNLVGTNLIGKLGEISTALE